MKAHKFKVRSERPGNPITLDDGFKGYDFTIQAVHYHSENPSSHVHIYDADGDECYFPVPGGLNPHVLLGEHITVKLPIAVVDETAPNDFTIFGVVHTK